MIDYPMGASGFETLASFYPDWAVVTQGPPAVSPGAWCPKLGTPQVNAEDVHLVVRAARSIRSPESSLPTPVIAPTTHQHSAGDLT